MANNNDIDKVLADLGILTKNPDNSLRSFNEVFHDIKNAFFNLSAEQQDLLITTLAGEANPNEVDQMVE